MENEKKTPVSIVVAIIGALALISVPVVGRLVDIYLPTPIPTVSPQPSPISSSTIQQITLSTSAPTQVFAPTVLASAPPLPEGYISLGGFHFGKENSGGKTGNQIYSHFLTGKIKYTSIIADDDIEMIELVCSDRVIDISEMVFPIQKEVGEIFPQYASEPLVILSNCRVDFHVVDILGGGTGITVKAESVP